MEMIIILPIFIFLFHFFCSWRSKRKCFRKWPMTKHLLCHRNRFQNCSCSSFQLQLSLPLKPWACLCLITTALLRASAPKAFLVLHHKLSSSQLVPVVWSTTERSSCRPLGEECFYRSIPAFFCSKERRWAHAYLGSNEGTFHLIQPWREGWSAAIKVTWISLTSPCAMMEINLASPPASNEASIKTLKWRFSCSTWKGSFLMPFEAVQALKK